MLTVDSLPDAAQQTVSGGPGVPLAINSVVGLVITALGSATWYSVAPVLADASTGETIGAGAVLVALGAAGKWLADWFVKLRKDRSEDEDKREARRADQLKAEQTQRAQEKASEIIHLEKALDRETGERRQLQQEQAADRRQHATEMNELRSEFVRAKIQASRAVTWIRSMEGLLRAKKIEHVPFDDDGDDNDGDGGVRMHGPHGPDAPGGG